MEQEGINLVSRNYFSNIYIYVLADGHDGHFEPLKGSNNLKFKFFS